MILNILIFLFNKLNFNCLNITKKELKLKKINKIKNFIFSK